MVQAEKMQDEKIWKGGKKFLFGDCRLSNEWGSLLGGQQPSNQSSNRPPFRQLEAPHGEIFFLRVRRQS
jgi:hypothetical protein